MTTMRAAMVALAITSIAGAGCASDGVARDCDHAVAALQASGAAECTTWCTTSIPCADGVSCTLAPYGCNARWAQCSSGRLAVYTTGHACDAGPPERDAATDAAPAP